ncbi:MAG: CBS domain-containing protein [Gammaproteobacteria bacterium]|nr:CBS domain-containing protein [Gammaproteobacteria bacterium]
MIKMKDIIAVKGNKIWSVDLGRTVFEALELMAEKEIGALLVMDGDRIKGLFSERDYARKVILKGRTSQHTNISDVMTNQVIYITPEHSAEQCMALMTEKHIRHLPVMDNDRLLGLVSIGDLVKFIISDQQSTIEVLEKYITS